MYVPGNMRKFEKESVAHEINYGTRYVGLERALASAW
jgi:hypothetical protein